MRSNSSLVVAGLLALAVLLGGRATAEAQDRWLVMVYVAADNDMEPQLVNDVLELARANAGPNVEIMVQMDRRRGWNGTPEDEEVGIPGVLAYVAGIRRFRIVGNRADGVVNPGAGDSGNPSQLEGFINWALDNASADFRGSSVRHALVMIGPGAGWRGALQDDSTRSSTAMTAAQMATAINAAYGATHEASGRLRLVAAGASLFGTLENALDLSEPMSTDSTAHLVLSEDVFPETGFAFEAWLNGLASMDAVLTPAGVAESLVQTTAASIPDSTDHVIASIAVSGLRGAGTGFTSASMATNFVAASHARPLAEARAEVLAFGVGASNDSYNLVDARRLLTSTQAGITAAGAAAWDGLSAASAALDRAVVYIQRGSARTNAGGLSMYLPVAARLGGDPAARVDAGSGGTSWVDFITAYAGRSAMDTTPPPVMMAAAQEEAQEAVPEGSGGGAPARRVRFTATTVGDDIDDVTFVLGVPFEGGVAFFGETPIDQGGGAEGVYAGGAVDYVWDGTWMGIASTASTEIEPAAFFVMDRYLDAGGMPRATYAVPVRFDNGFGGIDVLDDGILLFDVDLALLTGSLVGVYAVDDASADVEGVYEIDLDTDAVVIPMVPVVTDTGEYMLLEVGAPIDVASMTVAPFAVGDGFYEIGLHVTDLYGNETTELAAVFLGEEAAPVASGCSASPAGGGGSAAWLVGFLGLGVLAMRRRVRARTALGLALLVAGCSGGSSRPVDAGRDARPLIEDAGPCEDDDMDAVCDWEDGCYGHDDREDADGDRIPDGCDCDASGSACDANAACFDGDEGVVCDCNPGFIGEGDVCTPEADFDGGTMADAGPSDLDGGVPSDGGPPPPPPAAALFVDLEATRPTLAFVNEDGSFDSAMVTTGDVVGNWNLAAGLIDPADGLAHVIFTATGSGGGRYVSIDLSTGDVTVLVASVPFSGGWDHIIPVACDRADCDRYFFNDADTGAVAVVEFSDATGTWASTQTDSGSLPSGSRYDDAWRMAWDDSGTGYIGLHRASDGFFARLGIATAGATRGQFVRVAGVIRTDGFGGTFPGFDLATAIGERGYLTGTGSTDEVFLYRLDGSASLARMSPASAVGLIDYAAGSFGPWSDIETLDNGVTVFYHPDAAPAAFGDFDPARTPIFVQTDSEASLSTGFEHVAALVTKHNP